MQAEVNLGRDFHPTVGNPDAIHRIINDTTDANGIGAGDGVVGGASMLKMGAVWGIKGWRDLLVLGFAEFILTP
jgi:hypothetical protein